MLPRAVLHRHGADATPLTDADPLRSPQPPDAVWRVGTWTDREDG